MASHDRPLVLIAVLEQLLSQPGCPVCAFGARVADRYLGAEREAGAVADLGLCTRHAAAMQSGPRRRARLVCPACRAQRAAEIAAIDALIDGLWGGELLDAWARSDDLCSVHARMARQRGGGVRRLLQATRRAERASRP